MGRTRTSPDSGQTKFESRQRAEKLPSPGSGQNKFESRQRAEQVRVQAAGRASSSPESGQNKFESRQISRNQETPTRASPQRVVYPSIIQRRVLAQSMPNLYPNLEGEIASPDSNTANMTEYISVGEALKLAAPFKGEKKDVLP